jgi:ribonuclease HI
MSIYHCYTDGACSKNGKTDALGGWAFIIVDENDQKVFEYSKKVTTYVSNNRMELLGLLKCCEYCKKFLDNENEPNDFILYTDSAYCQTCYNQKWYVNWQHNGWKTYSGKPVLNQALWEELIPYFTNPHFIINKVKGHASDKWNNEVDKLAVEARKS